MKKLVTILVILGLAGLANAAFTDDFDSNISGNSFVWSAGQPVPGLNGWVPAYLNGDTTVQPSAVVDVAGTGVGTTQGLSQPTDNQTYVAGRDITGDVGGNGAYEARLMGLMDPDGPAPSGVQGNNIQLHVGDNSLINGGGLANRQGDFVLVNSAGSFAVFSYNGAGNGSFNVMASAINHDAVGWFEIVMSYTGIGTAGVATLNDVDDNTGAFISQIVQQPFLIAPTFSSFDAAVIYTQYHNQNGLSRADNFASTPEPMTLGVLALGALAALLRRRR